MDILPNIHHYFSLKLLLVTFGLSDTKGGGDGERHLFYVEKAILVDHLPTTK